MDPAQRFRAIKRDGLRFHFFDDMSLDLTHDMHFTGFTVKHEGQLFLAIDQLEGFCSDGALDASDSLGLLGAK